MDTESKSKRGAQLFALRKLQIASTTVESTTIAGVVLKAVLRAIDDHGANCWAKATTIGEEACLCDRTVRRAIKALKSLDYIVVDSRPGTTSLMKINWDNIPNPNRTPDYVTGVQAQVTPDYESKTPDSVTDLPRTIGPLPRTIVPTTPDSVTDEAIKKRKKNRKENRNRNEISIRDSLFNEFWESYPKKEGKKKAEEAFNKAVKNGADPQAIIEGAKEYAQSDKGTGDPQYIKQPTTFLNGQHWEDDREAWSKKRSVQFEDPCHKPFPKLKVNRTDLAIDDFVYEWNRALNRIDYLSDETRTIAREVFNDEWWLESRKLVVDGFADRERLIRIGKLKDSPYPQHIRLDWIFDNAALVKSIIGSKVPNEMDHANFGGNE